MVRAFRLGIPVLPQPNSLPGGEGASQREACSTVALWTATLASFCLTLLLRYVAYNYENDDFVPLAKARQILHGELPFRDFIDQGYYLQVFASAALQRLFGHQLLSETLFVCALLAASVAGICWLVSMSTGSVRIGLTMAALAFVTYPKFYNYPKVLPFVVALLAFWHYAAHPTTRRGVLVGLSVLVGFFYRHDIGFYVALGAVVLMLACHRGQRPFPLSVKACGLTVLLGLAPFLIYLQLNGGVLHYARLERDFVTGMRDFESQFTRPFFGVDLSQPPVEWRGESNLPLRILPGVFSPDNALAWLYWLYVALAPLAIIQLVRGRNPAQDGWPAPIAWVWALIVMTAVAQQGLLREGLEDRFADVGAPTAVLGGWLVAQWLSPGKSDLRIGGVSIGPRARLGLALVTLAITALSFAPISPFARLLAPSTLVAAVHRGPMGMVAQFADVTRTLATRPPIDAWDVPGNPGLPRLARWINTCTEPEDRVLATWFASELYFYSDRAFGGGLVFLLPGIWIGNPDQYVMIGRMESHWLPVIISEMTHYRNIRPGFDKLDRYIEEHYRVAREDPFGHPSYTYRVWVHNDARTLRPYEPLGLPCFRP